MTKRRRYHTAHSCSFLPCVSVRASLSAAAWRGALSCASLDVRELTYISLEKKLVQQPVRMCGGRESAPERTSKWTSERTGKQACSSQRTDAHPVQRERREGDPGLSVPCLVIRSCLSLTTTQGYFSKRTERRKTDKLCFPFAWKFGRWATLSASAASANCFLCLRSCIYR